MGNWSKKFSKVLTAAGISAIIAFGSLVMPIEASAARTVTDNVMIRNEPSTDGGIIGSLNEGDEVTILDVMQSGDGYAWYYIQLENGATGYVRSDLIEADDSELAAFRDNGQENTQAEGETEETSEEETSEEETAETEETASTQTEAAPEQAPAEATAANAGTEGYDATKDPNANFRAGYEQEADGTVTWYVYNDDNGSKVRISDLQAQENAADAAKGGSGIWRTLAIVFGIIALALAAFVLFLLKQIRDGRSKTTRGRALEAAASARDDEDEEEEFYFEDDEPADDEPVSEEADTEEADESAETETEDVVKPEEEREPEAAEERALTPDSTITVEVPEEAEPTEIPAEEIEAAIAATTAQLEENISKDKSAAEEAAEEEVFEEQSADAADEEFEEESVDYEDEEIEDDDYEDEEYEDYEDDAETEEFDEDDEEYEDEDYEDDESESRTARRSASKGGFFGFLKKMFGSDSDEDAEDPDEGGDFDDYEDEPDDHEFDEFKEYPEDIDLLPREEEDDSDYLEEDDFSEEDAGEEDSERGRLSMQRVMKNVSYKEDESDFYKEGDPNDLSDSLFEDDDDMEYSFISSRKK